MKPKSKLQRFTNSLKQNQKLALVAVMVLFGGVGVYLLNASNAATSVRIGTYNILWEERKDIEQRVSVPSVCSSAQVQNGDCSTIRARRVAKIVKGDAGVRAFDIVGFQEVGPHQFKALNDSLPGYAHYPQDYYNNNHTTESRLSQRPIYWKKSQFERIGAGVFHFSSYYDRDFDTKGASPWVKLKDKGTGAELYVLNVHPVANIGNNPGDAAPDYPIPFSGPNPTDTGGALKREDTAKRINNWVADKWEKTKDRRHSTIVVLGDFNSRFSLMDKDHALNGDRSRIPYCIVTRPDIIQHAYDAANNRTSGTCPTPNNTGDVSVDHIYVRTKYTNVNSYRTMKTANDMVDGTSDHRPVYSDITIR